MALNLKSGLSFGCLGVKDLGFRPPRGSSSACLAVVRSVDDESTSNSAAELRKIAHQTDSKLAKNLNRDFNSLPRPLSVADFSHSQNNGSKMRISYKGIPGTYSEDAALKAYPECETVPCDEFEDAFKVVFNYMLLCYAFHLRRTKMYSVIYFFTWFLFLFLKLTNSLEYMPIPS
nr:arogenate dehydratase/prephenate dehydratase 1, chloroplastic-like isoform X1 [Ipomoea batatas]